MDDRSSRRYVDSNAIIHLVERHPEYAPAVEQLLIDARTGAFQVVVSALSIVEVTRSPGRPVDPARFPRISSFFENDFVFIRAVDVDVAERAFNLILNHTWLYPADAIHVAAAIATGCDILYTYDEELIRRLDGLYRLRFERPARR